MALVIVGVIAGMTLPPLIESSQKTGYVSGLQKASFVVNQVVDGMIADYGSIPAALESCGNNGSYTTGNFATLMMKKMRIAKDCGHGSTAIDKGCWPSKVYFLSKSLTNGGVNYMSSDHDYLNYWASSSFLTKDDISFNVILHGTPAPWSGASNIYAQVGVDVNGPNNGPNTLGRDVFYFWITDTRVVPWGGITVSIWTYSNANTCSTSGCGCAAKVLSEGAMNY